MYTQTQHYLLDPVIIYITNATILLTVKGIQYFLYANLGT